jgi:hypothetical protein
MAAQPKARAGRKRNQVSEKPDSAPSLAGLGVD